MTAGHIYVLGFSNGCVKVGRTKNSGQRLGAHKSAAGKFGLTITDEWTSEPHAEWMQNEDALKRIAEELGGTLAGGKEYFTGVEFAAVMEEALALPFTAAEEPAQAELEPVALPASQPAARRYRYTEADFHAALYPTAAMSVLIRPAGRSRITKIHHLLDLEASAAREVTSTLYDCIQNELSALLDEFTQENRKFTQLVWRLALEARQQREQDAA